MIKIFESKNYASLMYLLILITLIAITFNLANITNNVDNSGKIDKLKLTGYIVSENNNNIEATSTFSLKSYAIYYLVLLFIVSLISLVLATFILPRIKYSS